MSFYSGGEVKTRTLDPVNDISNVRSEFRLDSIPVIMSNMRLGNVGLQGGAGATNKYNPLTGSYGVIRNIRLMDGQTEISSLRDANRWLGFKNAQLSNSKNESVNRYISNDQLGFYVDSDSLDAGVVRDDNPSKIGTGVDSLGHLDLRQVLPVLNTLRSLNNKVFPKLRLVIEYEDNIRKRQTDATANNTSRPILIVDEMIDEGVVNSEIANFPKQITWLEIEHDSFHITAPDFTASDHVSQSVSNKVNGFNNKNLQRLLVLKNCDDESSVAFVNAGVVQGNGNMDSLGQFKQVVSYVVNGKNILTGKGAEGVNRRIALTCDTWGDLNISPLSIFQGADTTYVAGANDNLGHNSYDGVYIGEDISDLKVGIDRVCISNSGGVQPTTETSGLVVNLYGEVMKTLNSKGDEYVVGYA